MEGQQMHSQASGATESASEGQGSAPPCEACHKPFSRKRRWQRFCSTKCRNAFHHRANMASEDRVADLERRVKVLEERLA